MRCLLVFVSLFSVSVFAQEGTRGITDSSKKSLQQAKEVRPYRKTQNKPKMMLGLWKKGAPPKVEKPHPVLQVIGVAASPAVPAAFLLAKPATVPNRKNIRRIGKLDFSAGIVSSNGSSNIGFQGSYVLTRDLNHWTIDAELFQYIDASQNSVEVKRAGFQYRLFPYRKFQMGITLMLSKWSYSTNEETTFDFGFPVTWQAAKDLSLFYKTQVSYWGDSNDVSAELAAGISYKLAGILTVNAQVKHLSGRSGVIEPQTLRTFNFGLHL